MSSLRCPRPLNRGVRSIQVFFTVNVGEKKWDLCCCPLNRGCPHIRNIYILKWVVLPMTDLLNYFLTLELSKVVRYINLIGFLGLPSVSSLMFNLFMLCFCL